MFAIPLAHRDDPAVVLLLWGVCIMMRRGHQRSSAQPSGAGSRTCFNCICRLLGCVSHDSHRQPSYSNAGFAYLGRFLEGVAGATWEDFTTANILKPLGMTNTLFAPPDDLDDMGA